MQKSNLSLSPNSDSAEPDYAVFSRRRLESAYPSVLSADRDMVIGAFVRCAATLPPVTEPAELLRAVRRELRSRIRPEKSNGKPNPYQLAIQRLNEFPRAGRTFAARCLDVVASGQEATF